MTYLLTILYIFFYLLFICLPILFHFTFFPIFIFLPSFINYYLFSFFILQYNNDNCKILSSPTLLSFSSLFFLLFFKKIFFYSPQDTIFLFFLYLLKNYYYLSLNCPIQFWAKFTSISRTFFFLHFTARDDLFFFLTVYRGEGGLFSFIYFLILYILPPIFPPFCLLFPPFPPFLF